MELEKWFSNCKSNKKPPLRLEQKAVLGQY